MEVIFNREYHLGKWYKKGESEDLRYRLAVRLINNGIVHIPVKEIKSESKVAKEKEVQKKPVRKRADSKRTVKRSAKVGRQKDSGADIWQEPDKS